MNAIIINSAAGIGKTTLLKLLENKLSNDHATVYGDDIGSLKLKDWNIAILLILHINLSIKVADIIYEKIKEIKKRKNK